MASEVVELLPWDKLAVTRKNKKSIDCQNQRVIIDFDSFYTVMIAHVALEFSSRQIDLIRKAKALCECLMASEGIDLKFEEAICLLLLQGDDAEIKKLHQLKLSAEHASQNSDFTKQNHDASLPDQSLEMWLKDAVLGIFSDTRDCSPSLAGYFSQEKIAMDSNQNKAVSPTLPSVSQRQLYRALFSDRRLLDENPPSQHLRPVIQQQAPSNLHNIPREIRTRNQSDMTVTSSQFNRDLGFHHNKAVESWLLSKYFVESVAFVAVLGCVVVASCKLLGMHSGKLISSQWVRRPNGMDYSSFSNHGRHFLSDYYSVHTINNLLTLVLTRLRNPSNAGNQKSLLLTVSLLSKLPAVCSRAMDVVEAEALVRQ